MLHLGILSVKDYLSPTYSSVKSFDAIRKADVEIHVSPIASKAPVRQGV
jgi:hypothetical protein